MPPSGNARFLDALKAFASDLKTSYGSLVVAQQEEQLKGPTGSLLSACGNDFDLDVLPRFDGPVPRGTPRLMKAIPDTPQGYPEDYSYDPKEKTLTVGEGEIRPVAPEVYNYDVSGLEVVKSWLGYRMRNPRGRRSSPLDEIRPERWTGEMTRELLELLWVLEATVEREPEFAELLTQITASEVFSADELPEPTEEERKPPKMEVDTGQARLQ